MEWTDRVFHDLVPLEAPEEQEPQQQQQQRDSRPAAKPAPRPHADSLGEAAGMHPKDSLIARLYDPAWVYICVHCAFERGGGGSRGSRTPGDDLFLALSSAGCCPRPCPGF